MIVRSSQDSLHPRLIRSFLLRLIRMLPVQFMNNPHDGCQRFIERFRCIDDTPAIIELLKAWFPVLPFFPGGNLEFGDLPLASFEAPFLYIRRALAVYNQQGGMEFPRQLLCLFKRCAIGERSIDHNAEAQAQLFACQSKHQLVGKLANVRQVAKNIHCHLA